MSSKSEAPSFRRNALIPDFHGSDERVDGIVYDGERLEVPAQRPIEEVGEEGAQYAEITRGNIADRVGDAIQGK